MKKSVRSKAFVLTTAILCTASLLFTACGSGNTGATGSDTSAGAEATTTAAQGNSGEALSGKVTLSGSTSVQPLAQDLADAFQDIQTGVEVDVQGGGSSQGVKDANEKVSDIGDSSRDLEGDEKNWGLTEHVIAYDGVAVVVHPSNPVSSLTKDQIVQIFKGEIKNWKDVGGPDKEILVVSREDGSGTRTAFEELLKLQEKKDGKTLSLVAANALIAGSTGEVAANVSTKDNAIGYTSLGFVDDSMKKVSIDGTECTVDTVKSKAYPISRPFLMLTKGDVRPEVQAFLDFILGDKGQEIVGQKYIRVK